eukprot:CAMPEP_0202955736 /NCGR_PEP_ID=MMETSP1396-20130829/265_1 /ASSEMBLY_ACC=CAM_ASM_000872 /TAXON_ID= /ORGANISM="Pseudokeronopsis sp., Strain Brazil" /LENGTH=40 /DNA_ID= /DNA_START= /DNA_END= /DNA_ORIENTATION=
MTVQEDGIRRGSSHLVLVGEEGLDLPESSVVVVPDALECL